MNYIEVTLDGHAFGAHEVQMSLLMQIGEELPVTSPIVIHLAPIEGSVFADYWGKFMESGDRGVEFGQLSCEAILAGDDRCTTVIEGLKLVNADRPTQFLTFFAKSLIQIPNDSNHNQ